MSDAQCPPRPYIMEPPLTDADGDMYEHLDVILLQAYAHAMEHRADRLQAIVDTLPNTADGVPVGLGMDVWMFDHANDGAIQCLVIRVTQLVAGLTFHGTDIGSRTTDKLYASRAACEAAEAARADR